MKIVGLKEIIPALQQKSCVIIWSLNTVMPCSNSEVIAYIENMHEQLRGNLFFSEVGKN